jgi:hypothetical protein
MMLKDYYIVLSSPVIQTEALKNSKEKAWYFPTTASPLLAVKAIIHSTTEITNVCS